jgi:hypothetical protein
MLATYNKKQTGTQHHDTDMQRQQKKEMHRGGASLYLSFRVGTDSDFIHFVFLLYNLIFHG